MRKLHYEVEQNAIVGKPLVDIEQGEAPTSPTASASASQQPTQPVAAADAKSPETSSASAAPPSAVSPPANVPAAADGGRGVGILATPAVRRMALEHKLSLGDVRGSGKDGRILKEDVLRHVEELRSGKAPPQQPEPSPTLATTLAPTPSPVPVFVAPAVAKAAPPKPVVRLEPSPFGSLKPEQLTALIGANRVEPLRGVRKSMYKSMTAALAIPSFGFMDEVDLGALVTRKAALRAQFAERGLKFSYMPFFMKAASLALRSYPVLNASIDEKGESIVYKVLLLLLISHAQCTQGLNCSDAGVAQHRRGG